MLKTPIRSTLIIGSAAYFILGCLALIFYLERTVFADLACHTVTMLVNKSLFIQNQRFVAAFTQFFPLAASGLHLSLKGVLMAYSVSFIALYSLVFLVCTAWLKNWKMGLVMLLLSTMLVKDTFYWAQSELPQGMAILVLTLAVLIHLSKQTDPGKGWLIGFVFLLWVVVAYAHPMLAFPAIFALLFLGEKTSDSSGKLRKWLAASLVFVIGILIFKNKLLGAAAYDTESMSRIKNLWNLFPHYFNLAANRDFLYWCITDYWLLTVGFLTINLTYFRQKNWRKSLLFNGFFLGYLLLVNVSIPDGFHQFYMENLYLPLGFFVALPLVMDILPSFGKDGAYPRWAFSALAVCIGIRLLGIGMAHQPWTERLAWKQQFMLENKGKLLLDESLIPLDKVLMSWGSSFEFMLLSSLQNPQETRLITLDENPSRFSWATNQPRSVITEWEVWGYEKLPVRYFNPQDTSLYVIRNKQ